MELFKTLVVTDIVTKYFDENGSDELTEYMRLLARDSGRDWFDAEVEGINVVAFQIMNKIFSPEFSDIENIVFWELHDMLSELDGEDVDDIDFIMEDIKSVGYLKRKGKHYAFIIPSDDILEMARDSLITVKPTIA